MYYIYYIYIIYYIYMCIYIYIFIYIYVCVCVYLYVYSQASKIESVCSQESDFHQHSWNLRSWFLKRSYPEKIINTEISKVKFNVDNKRSNNRQKKRIPSVVIFHPKLKVLKNITKKHLYLLYMNNEVKRFFTPKPMVLFSSSRKISSYLVRAKLCPIERTVGSLRVEVNIVKSVNTSLKLILLILVSLEKHIKLIIV